MLDKINELLNQGKARKHYTYDQTGIVCVDLRKISGTAGIDVDFAFISPDEIDIISGGNVHYGYGYFLEDGTIEDRSHRSVFEIV
jgi:hypothetical protein